MLLAVSGIVQATPSCETFADEIVVLCVTRVFDEVAVLGASTAPAPPFGQRAPSRSRSV